MYFIPNVAFNLTHVFHFSTTKCWIRHWVEYTRKYVLLVNL